MKKVNYLVALALVTIMGACSPSTKITGSWTGPNTPSEPYKSIFVTAISENLVARQTIENDIDAMLQKDGVEAKSSFDIIPPGFKATAENKEATVAAIRDGGSDAILTIALLDQTSETRYVPGTTMYSPMGYGGYYGRFSGYYSYYNPVMYSPGYYSTDKNYYIEINLYDAKTEELVWSAQSETTNPSSIETFSNAFSQLVVNQLLKDGLIAK
ncbi:MAG: hypothetical protein P8O16_00840 [Algoriphagus sp.]|jgi:hypothetical protein|uniref:hypothetical protein n=1 Tax=Algoriphagus sp. TaxID=1872435 RepID=UPI002621C691|nr:hypothetical protein [Algoriphagus sp.]MDG1275792.1 hypothetical protein [Algoriphagus sp.]